MCGDDEIEVTPEMIEAGVVAYYSVDMRVADQAFLVLKIFVVMAAARRRGSCENCS
jgi:hypothetical protein